MRFFTVIYLSLFIAGFIFAQSGKIFPDSLQEVTVTGTVSIDSSNANLMYYLDTDGDNNPDFWLKFGPPWYTPGISEAMRPLDGEGVKIYGAVYEPVSSSIPAIIVYEINDLFWRDPFLPVWNPTVQNNYRHNHNKHGHVGYAGGWLCDSLDVDSLTVEGIVMIDTTFFYGHYYLDTDNDLNPDYYLSFGPQWYIPESGLERPEEGDFVTIVGLMINDRLHVLLLNDEVWFELPNNDCNFGGKWIFKNMNQNRYIHTPYDSLSGMRIHAGWDDGKSNNPDSMYCQMLRLFPEDLPKCEGEHIFAGFEIGLFTKMKNNLMIKADSTKNPVKLAVKIQYRFHYEDNHFSTEAEESRIRIHTWNSETSDWEIVENFVLDTEANLVSYESETVSNLIILTSTNIATSISKIDAIIPEVIVLKQNYPNPFNPSTNIEFYISKKSNVRLNVYNVLGQNVYQFSKAQMDAGTHIVRFGSPALASGIYFYELLIDNKSVAVKKMNLLR